MITLELSYGSQTFIISRKSPLFTLGRYLINDLILDYDFISGCHGQIYLEKGQFFYEDLNSANGTYMGDSGQKYLVHTGKYLLGSKGWLYPGKENGIAIGYVGGRMELTAPDRQKDLMDEGLCCLKSADFIRAQKKFDQVIEIHPENGDAYYYAGFTAARSGRMDFAIQRFEQYLMIRPGDSGVMLDLGKIYEKSGNMKLASHWYKKILEKEKDNREVEKRLQELERFKSPRSGSSKKHCTRELLQGTGRAFLNTPHFRITYSVAEHIGLLKRVIKELEMARQEVGGIMNYFPDGKIKIRMTGGGAIPSGETRSRGIDLNLDGSHSYEKLFLSVLIKHEYTHYALGRLTAFSPRIPWWIHEGFAQFMSQTMTPNRLLDIERLARHNKLIPLGALESGTGDIKDREILRIAYLEAHSAVVFFIKENGIKVFLNLVKGFCREKAPDRAFLSAGLARESFEASWSRWLIKSAEKGEVNLTRKL